jgi:hypothetical protein
MGNYQNRLLDEKINKKLQSIGGILLMKLPPIYKNCAHA